MLNVKNADMADFEQIMKIYKYAQDYMIKSGNPTQWGHFYPDADLIKSDIDKNACKVIYDKDGIHGVFSVFDDHGGAGYQDERQGTGKGFSVVYHDDDRQYGSRKYCDPLWCKGNLRERGDCMCDRNKCDR